MILETLPESFDTFKWNYSMNKLEYTVTKLMKELHTAEGLTKRKRNQRKAYATEHKASTSESKKRLHKADKENQCKVQKKKKPRPVEADKSNDKRHHCNEPGHWRRNCPAYLKTKEKGKAKA